jgi:hypothetical protein
MRLDRAGKIMDVDHNLLDARGPKALEHMIQQRPSCDLD